VATPAGEGYRFIPAADGLAKLFRRYEAERRNVGISTTFIHVSPQQRIDTIATIAGLNAAGGWRRQPDEDAEELWLRYLRPVLAETRESADALARAVRDALPGDFVPAIGKSPPPPPRLPPPWPEPVRLQKPRWRRMLALALERGVAASRKRRVQVGAVAAVGIAVLAWWMPRLIEGSSVPVVLPPVASPEVIQQDSSDTVAPPQTAGGIEGDQDYRFALSITLRAAEDTFAGITPQELAEIYAGESGSVADPAVFLAAMFQDWPLHPQKVIPPDRAGAFALTRYAKVFVDIERSDASDLTRPALDQTTAEDQDLRERLLSFGQGGSSTSATAAMATTDWTAWLRWLTLLPIAAALVVSRLWWVAAFKAQLTNPATGDKGRAADLPLAHLALTAPPPARRLVRQISWREPGIARRIHGEASVRATIRRGGFLTIVPRLSRRSADFVFLVPRRRKNDHERDRVSRFIEALRRGGLSLEVYDYDPDPRTLYPQRPTGRATVLDLRALRELHAEARLVLVTDGAELVNFFTAQPLSFVEDLATWPAKMLLTPLPMDEWGEREMNLTEALGALIGRATPDGFRDLTLAFGERPTRPWQLRTRRQAGDDDGTGRLMVWLEAVGNVLGRGALEAERPEAVRFDDPMLVSEAPPPEHEQRSLVNELRQWLGPRGFEWLAACAAYPELRFAITLYLGLKLVTRYGPVRVPLYDEALLARLTLLPWFRIGRMPRWFRRAMFATLSEVSRQRVRTVVAEMLSYKEVPDDNLPEETHLPIWRLAADGTAVPPDAVMADLLFRDASDIDPVLRGGAFAEVFKEAARRVRGQHLVGLLATTVWCAIAFWLWPNLGTPPYAVGIWLPLASFVTLTILLGLAWGAVHFWRRLRPDRVIRGAA
jgi:hypothetical protein